MKQLVGLFFLITVSLSLNAQIQTRIEPNKPTSNQVFKLIFTYQKQIGSPDLTILEDNFLILGTERREDYSIINGQTHSQSQYIVSLKAKKPGKITIPSMKFGNESSEPLMLTIAKESPRSEQLSNSDPIQDDVVLKTKINESTAYINQQLTLTVSLYNSKHLLDAAYQEPKVQDALLFPLGSTKRYQTTKDNKEYIVEEQNYAIFPQKSGPLTITSPQFTALVYDFQPRRVIAQDNPIQIKVLPAPKASSWFPAQKVTLSDKYEAPEQAVTVGDTLTRIINLKATGQVAQLFPTLSFNDTDYYRVYVEKGEQKNQVKHDELIGQAKIKVTYLFTKPGQIMLPAIEFPWFNTTDQKEERAILAPKSLKIATATPSKAPSIDVSPPKPAQQPIVEQTRTFDVWPWSLTFLFATAWIITILFVLKQKKTLSFSKGESKALKKLTQACKENNPQKAKEAMMQWASLRWPQHSVHHVTALTQLIHHPHLKREIQDLAQSLYGPQKNKWQGDKLLKALHEFLRKKENRKIKPQPQLPPLNP